METTAWSDRYHVGTLTLAAVGGSYAAPLLQRLRRLSPELPQVLVETAYGDLISRPALSLPQREVATVATLAACGDVPIALKFHCAGMLNTGWQPRALIETVLSGIANQSERAATSAIDIACEVLIERYPASKGNSSRSAADGLLPEMFVGAASDSGHTFACAQAALASHLDKIAAGAFDGPGLPEKSRQLAALAVVITARRDPSVLRDQIRQCMEAAWTRDELAELIMHMTAYIGWPVILNVVAPAAESFERFASEAADGRVADPVA
jgi:4-carboxymuconolactone decarboxylase